MSHPQESLKTLKKSRVFLFIAALIAIIGCTIYLYFKYSAPFDNELLRDIKFVEVESIFFLVQTHSIHSNQ